MKRYAVFAGENYDSGGGMDDLDRCYISLSGARKRAKKRSGEGCWSHIADLDSMRVVAYYGSGIPCGPITSLSSAASTASLGGNDSHSWNGDITVSGLEPGDAIELSGLMRTVTKHNLS